MFSELKTSCFKRWIFSVAVRAPCFVDLSHRALAPTYPTSWCVLVWRQLPGAGSFLLPYGPHPICFGMLVKTDFMGATEKKSGPKVFLEWDTPCFLTCQGRVFRLCVSLLRLLLLLLHLLSFTLLRPPSHSSQQCWRGWPRLCQIDCQNTCQKAVKTYVTWSVNTYAYV